MRRNQSVWIAAATLGAAVFSGSTASARIPEPDHIFYGSAASYGLPVSAGVVTAFLGSDPAPVATFVLGPTNAYVLRVPMDSVEPRDPGTARPADAIRFFINGQLAGTSTVGERGQAQALNLDERFDDALSISDATVTEGDSGALDVAITLQLAGAGGRDVAVDVATADGSAKAGSDYTAVQKTRIVFAPGTTVKQLNVSISGDSLREGPETFLVNLSNPANAAVLRPQATVTIVDNETAPLLSLANVIVREGNAGATNAVFTATLSAGAATPVIVDFATSDGSASAGLDYVSAAGTLTFPAGNLSQSFSIAALGDRKREASEVFKVDLLNPRYGTLGQGQATGTIVDDDAPSADFDGDGQADILWRQQTEGWLVVWAMNGEKHSSTKFMTPNRLEDLNWKVAGTGDFDADGKTDLLWQNRNSRELYVWFMDGMTQVGGGYMDPTSPADPLWRLAGTGDFDSDGKTDLLWQHVREGMLYVWYMDGLKWVRGSYLDPSQVGDTAWKVIGTGDFDLDGQVDVLWQNQTTGALYAWLMNGIKLRQGQYLTPDTVARTGWELVALADYDQNGHLDLLWRNEEEGGWMFLWFMEGLTRKSGVYLNPARLEDLSWKIVGPR